MDRPSYRRKPRSSSVRRHLVVKFIIISAILAAVLTSIILNIYSDEKYAYKKSCGTKPCIIKCCGAKKYLQNLTSCVNVSGENVFENFEFPIFNKNDPSKEEIVDRGHFNVLYGYKKCSSVIVYEPELTYPLTNGSLLVASDTNFTETYTYNYNQYCMDFIAGQNQTILVQVCADNEKGVMHLGMMVSTPFLAATIIVYSLVPRLRNLKGKTLICQQAALLTAFICFIIANMGVVKELGFWCNFLGYTIQFFFLASFFWLSIFCFNIWQSFRYMRSPLGSRSKKNGDQIKFVWYSVYAWGAPLAIFLVTLGSDTVLSSLIPESYRANFASTSYSCWFDEQTNGKYVYLYAPMGLILFLNTMMFVSTAIKIRAVSRDVSRNFKKSAETKSTRTDKERFYLFLKMYTVMGVNWVTEILSDVFNEHMDWRVIDVINTLQGLLMFVIFVCNRRTLQLLEKQWRHVSSRVISTITSDNESSSETEQVTMTAKT